MTVPQSRTKNMGVNLSPVALTALMVFIGEPLKVDTRRIEVLDQLVVRWAFDGSLLRRSSKKGHYWSSKKGHY
jgi:hypothetical protein